MNWLTASFAVIALAACWYFHLVDKAQRKHDAMIDREEAKIRDDAKHMRAWYREGDRTEGRADRRSVPRGTVNETPAESRRGTDGRRADGALDMV